jgi:membrane-associated phospholipid phosphatase
MKNILLLSLFLFCSIPNSAQENKTINYFDTIINDAEIFFVDGYSFYTSPLRMNATEWAAAAGIGLGTYGLINLDGQMRKLITEKVDQNKSDFWIFFEKYGVIQYAEIAGAATYAVGLFSNQDDVRILGRMMVQSLTYSGLSTMFVRMIAGRKRPPFTDNHLDFAGFETDNRFQSFPSGHVTVAFAFSTVLAEYFDTPWSRIGFYSLAGLASAERLINSQHWFSDVVLGALVGIAGGLHVINEEAKREKVQNRGLVITPSFGGINLRYYLNSVSYTHLTLPTTPYV